MHGVLLNASVQAAAGGEFTPGSLYEALCMRINTAMAVLCDGTHSRRERSLPERFIRVEPYLNHSRTIQFEPFTNRYCFTGSASQLLRIPSEILNNC